MPESYGGNAITATADESGTASTFQNLVAETKYVVMADSIKTLGTKSFYNVTNLKAIKLSSALETVGEDAFWAESSISVITLPKSVKQIGGAAFACHVSIFTIPSDSNLEKIEGWAFSGAKFKYINLPNGLTHIGDGAFNRVSLETLCIPASVTTIEYMFYAYDTLPNLKYIYMEGSTLTSSLSLTPISGDDLNIWCRTNSPDDPTDDDWANPVTSISATGNAGYYHRKLK